MRTTVTQNVSFLSATEMLAGTLVQPEGTPPFPTALLIAGSGPLDRDGNHKKMQLNVSHDLAGELAAIGWATLRFDKRGIGESGGEYLSTGFFDEIADIEAAVEWLDAHPDVGCIVAIGHSAGAIQIAHLAAGETILSGGVLLATSAKTGEETLRWQAAEMQDALVPAPIKALLRLFRTSVLKQQDKAIQSLKATTTDVARIQLVRTNAKWMREFMAYDPFPALRSAQIPLLAITGSKDVQVDPADIATIREIAPEGIDAHVIDDVDHILRYEGAAISNPRLYRKQLEKPIDPRVIDAIDSWLRRFPRSEPTSRSGG